MYGVLTTSECDTQQGKEGRDHVLGPPSLGLTRPSSHKGRGGEVKRRPSPRSPPLLCPRVTQFGSTWQLDIFWAISHFPSYKGTELCSRNPNLPYSHHTSFNEKETR